MKEPTHNEGDFRQRVENYLPEDFPGELSWEQMSTPLLQGLAQERKRRRRRRFIAWFLPTMVSAIGVSLLLWGYPGPHSNLIQAEEELVSLSSEDPLTISHPDSADRAKTPKDPQEKDKGIKSPVSLGDNSPVVKRSTSTIQIQTPLIPSENQLRGSRGEERVLAPLSRAPFPLSLTPKIPKPLSSELVFFFPQKLPLSPRPSSALLVYGGINRFNSSFLPFEEGESITSNQRPDRMGTQVGIALQYPLSSSLLLTAGLELERLRFQVGFEKEESVQLFRPGTIDTLFINSRTGDSTFVFTDSIPGIRSLLLRNTFSSYTIKIPLALSHRLYLQKFSVDLQGGVSVGLFQRNRGLDNEQVQQLVGDTRLLSEQGVSIGLNGALQVMYPLTKNLQIVGIAGMEKGVGEWNPTPQSTYTQRPILYQLKLGITKLFPPKTK